MSRKSGKKLIIKKKITLSQSSKSSYVDKNRKSNVSNNKIVKPIPSPNLSKRELKNQKRGSVVSPSANKNLRLELVNKIFSDSYIKKENVDYDVIIIISSFNRYNTVDKIISDLTTQDTSYTFKIILLNDGSTDNSYNTLKDKYNSIDYIENKTNGGKKLYWESINKLLIKASEYKTHCYLQIDDDFLLSDNFIDDLLNIYFLEKNNDNKLVAISYHLCSIDDQKSIRWGHSGWIDGGGLYDESLFKVIGYQLTKINESRWDNKPLKSSGVWEQITILINSIKCRVLKLDISLAFHNDDNISKMNEEIRKSHPIDTYKFKNNKKNNE